MLEKVILLIGNLIDYLVIFSIAVVVLFGFYGIYDTHSILENAQDKSVLKYKPSSGTVLNQNIEGNVAWITLDDSKIDYPVMQATTNDYYIDRDCYGNYSLSGAIFLDYRNAPDFSDNYNLIYGHHMQDEMMFGALDNWLDETYFNSHSAGTLVTTSRIYHLDAYAVVETLCTTQELFQPTNIPFEETVNFIKENATFLNQNIVPEKLVALSTCKYPDTNDRALVIFSSTQIYKGTDVEVNLAHTDKKAFQNVEPLNRKDGD